MKNKDVKVCFDYVLGAEILRSLRDNVELKLKNEASFDDKDVIIIPLEDNKPKVKGKSLDRER